MQWPGTVLHRHDLNQGLREALGSFERETIIFILCASSEAQRGSVTSPQPHSHTATQHRGAGQTAPQTG